MYRCEKCEKEYDKRHAYIGHCSSHKVPRYSKSRGGKPKIKVAHICKFCGREFERGVSLGAHMSSCRLNPIYPEVIKKRSAVASGRVATPEQKAKMSQSRIALLRARPELHPNRILANNRHKLSYPERLCVNFLESASIDFESNKCVRGYYPDLVIEGKHIVEIDGEFWHRNDDSKKRTLREESLLDAGYQTMDRIGAKNVLSSLKEILSKYKINPVTQTNV